MSEFLKVAYRKLGLPMKGHDIGTMRYIDLPEDVLQALCALHLDTVNAKLYEDRPPATNVEEDRKWCWDVRVNSFLLYPRWLHILKNIKSHQPTLWQDATLTSDIRFPALVECHFVYDRYEGGKYEPSLAGWKKYLREVCPQFYEFLCRPVPLKIPESARLEHTYLCGATGSGKTELLKLLIHSYMLNHPDVALVIIEPTGKLSTEVAKFKENFRSDRLIYVTYDREHSLAPRINPLRISGVATSNTSTAALDIKSSFTDELVEALGEMIRAEGETQFTVDMQTALRRCVLVLLDKPGATLRDLVNFMNDGENGDLVDFALTRTYDRDSVSYFKTKFKAREAQITQTKTSLYSRLSNIIIGRTLAAVTCGENTIDLDHEIDLEREINAKKIIILELSGRFGPGQGPAFGRLILAMLKGMAMRREEAFRRGIDLVPVHVFIDECHNYVSASIKTIMREARKYKIILTLTQTEIGAEMPPATREAVLGGANLKIAGRAGEPHPVARLLRVEDADIDQLDNRQFFIRHGTLRAPIRFKAHSHLADKRHSMSEKQWEKVWRRQLHTYYRPVVRPTAQEGLSSARVQVQPPSRPKRAPKVEGGVAVRATDPDEDKPGRWGA